MADPINIGVYYSTLDAKTGFALAEALALDPKLRVRKINMEPAQRHGTRHDEWIVVVVSDRSLTYLGGRYFAERFRGPLSRERVVRVVISSLSELKPSLEPSPVLLLENWGGNASDGRIMSLRTFLTDDAWLQRGEYYGSIDRALAPHPHVEDSQTPTLLLKIASLGLSNRTTRALDYGGIIHLGDLVQQTEAELLRIPDFGRKALNEVKETLGYYNLRLGLDLPNWPPEDIATQTALAEAARKAVAIRQAPLGATFEPRQDYLVIDPAGDESDQAAASKPLVAQLHEEVVRKARQFGSVAPRLDNQLGWEGMNGLCVRLIALVDRPTADIPDVLGSLYGAALELGSFGELDRSLHRGDPSYAAALDPEVRRPLDDLLRSLAPWLRTFPTIKEMDDEAGRFLTPPPNLDPSARVFDAAGEAELVNDEDTAALKALVAAAKRGEFQGMKAGRRSIFSARNVIFAAVSVFSTMVLDNYAAQSILVGKVGAFLLQAEAVIIEVAAELPDDIRIAIETIVRESRETPLPPPAAPKPVRGEGLPGSKRPDGVE